MKRSVRFLASAEAEIDEAIVWYENQSQGLGAEFARGITADTALRLAKAFGTSEGFWLGLQADYDLEESRKIIGADLDRIEPLAA